MITIEYKDGKIQVWAETCDNGLVLLSADDRRQGKTLALFLNTMEAREIAAALQCAADQCERGKRAKGNV